MILLTVDIIIDDSKIIDDDVFGIDHSPMMTPLTLLMMTIAVLLLLMTYYSGVCVCGSFSDLFGGGKALLCVAYVLFQAYYSALQAAEANVISMCVVLCIIIINVCVASILFLINDQWPVMYYWWWPISDNIMAFWLTILNIIKEKEIEMLFIIVNDENRKAVWM